MDTDEIVEILDKIYDYIQCEQYDDVKEYIKREKLNVIAKSNPAEDYMNQLVGNLK